MSLERTPKIFGPWHGTEMKWRKLPLEISVACRVSCINALQETGNPASTIAEVKQVLRLLIKKMVAAGCADADVTQARQTLLRLEGAE